MDLFNTCERVDNKELEDFKTKYLSLEKTELFEAFRVDVKDVLNIVSESIPCVGCRRRYVNSALLRILRKRIIILAWSGYISKLWMWVN